jgi:hypothetical protein
MPLSDSPLVGAAARKAVRDSALKHGIDPDIFERMVGRESGFRRGALSNKGAIGYTQLMPDTARELGVNPNNDRENIEGGALYLRQNLDRFNGDYSKALAAYNAGPGAVLKYGGIPPYKETQQYVSSILGTSMPVTDSPLVQEDAARRQQSYADLMTASADMGERYSALASHVMGVGSGPAPPAMLARSLATLGSNLGSAISGRDMYAENTARSQQQEDMDFRQAQNQQRQFEQQKIIEQHKGMLEAARDRYLTAAQAAESMGNHAAAAELQDKALKAQDKIAGLHEQGETNRLNTQLSEEHKNRMDELTKQLSGQLEIAHVQASRTGNQLLDAVIGYMTTRTQVMSEVRQEYATAAGKKATEAGFKKYLANNPEAQAKMKMLEHFAPEILKPSEGMASQDYVNMLVAAGVSKEQIQRVVKVHYPNEKPERVNKAIETAPTPGPLTRGSVMGQVAGANLLPLLAMHGIGAGPGNALLWGPLGKYLNQPFQAGK